MRDPLVSPIEVDTYIKEAYGFNISYYLAWKSKDIASSSIRGDESLSNNFFLLQFTQFKVQFVWRD